MNLFYNYSCLFCSFILSVLAGSKAEACTGQDIVFTSITVTSIASNEYQYSYTIKNIGTEDIEIKKISIQNYVSTDDQVGGDAAGGGANIAPTNQGVLAPGESYSGTRSVYPFPQNPQSTYPYIIAHVYIYPDEECDKTNNYIVTPIEVATSVLHSSKVTKAIVDFTGDNNSFIVKEWSGNQSVLKYSLYTSTGSLLVTGTTQKNTPTPLYRLQKGYYILYLSDGENEYSQKIVY